MERPKKRPDIIGRPERHGWNECCDAWEKFLPFKVRVQAHEIIEKILRDLCNRGCDDWWENIDYDVQLEIRKGWFGIIKNILLCSSCKLEKEIEEVLSHGKIDTD